MLLENLVKSSEVQIHIFLYSTKKNIQIVYAFAVVMNKLIIYLRKSSPAFSTRNLIASDAPDVSVA